MKKVFTLALFLSALVSFRTTAAPLTGTYPVPSLFCPTLACLIEQLNLNGISGPVIINLNQNEVAPSGGYLLGSSLLNSTMSMTNTITINGKGWTLTANAGTGGQDAIFSIQGTDYVTINNMNLKDTATNTTNTTMMERGYSVVKFMDGTNIDAVKYLTIKGAHVDLFNTNTTAASGVAGQGSAGIFMGNCLYSSTTALAAPAGVEGAFETLFFSDDTIQNVTHGVYGRGLKTVLDGIVFADIQTTVQNSLIRNFTHNGITLANFNNDMVSANTIKNMEGGGSAPTDHSIYGVSYDCGLGTASNASWTCQNNIIDLSSASTATDYAVGIFSQINGSGTTTISGNTVDEAITGSGNILVGILAKNNGGTQTVNQNTVENFSVPSTNTSNIVGIWCGSQGAITPYAYPQTSKITANVIKDFAIGGGATIAGCIDQNLVSTDPSVFTGNTVSGFKFTGSATTFKCYQYRNTFGASSLTATGNSFLDIDASGTTMPGFAIDPASNANVVYDINNNYFKRFSFGTGTLTGVLLDFGSKATCSKDTFVNFKGNGDIHAFFAGNSGSAIATLQFDNNLIDSFASDGTGSVVTGINIYPGTTSTTSAATAYNNTISRLNSFGTSAVALGMAANGGSATYNVYNNMISDIAAPNSVTIFSSSYGLYMMGTGSNNINYNTVNLYAQANPTSGYGATGLMYSPAGTSTIKNNILRVNVVAGGGNNVAALRGNMGTAKSAPSASAFAGSNNIYFAPTGPNNYLYVEGSASTGLVNGYAVSGLIEDATQNIANDTFFNSDCGKSSYHKFMSVVLPTREKGTYTEDNLSGAAGWYAPSGYSYAESGATSLSAVGADIAGEARTTTPDIGALQFSGTLNPTMNIKVVSSTGFDVACPSNLPSLDATIPAFFGHTSFQWYKDTTVITGETTNSLIVDPAGGNYILQVYDSLTGCTYASDVFTVTIVPPPTALITYYDSLVFCETSSIVVSANFGADYTYQWYKDGTPISGSIDISKVISTSGNYQVEVNTPLGCPTMSAPIGVRVYPLPTPTITQIGTHQLKTNLYYTYQWYKDNKVIPDDPAHTSKGQSYYATEDGAYTVEVTDSNGCTNKSTLYLYSLGINDPSLAQAIQVYPNPTSGVVNIVSPVPVNVALTDPTGRVVMAPAKVKSIDLSNYAAGLYIMTLTDESGKEIRKEKITRLQQ